jgi:hypothetical protein
MAKTHNVGKFYWHTFVYPIKFKGLTDKAETQEIEPPYRGGHGVAIRLPFTKLALVLGKWTKQYDERVALTRAIAGRSMEQEEVNWDVIREGVSYDVEDI